VSQAAADQWIPSACGLCYGTCSIRGHVKDGVLVKIEGNPDSTIGRGRLCGKGVSGIMTLYDPNRLDVPLRRTNPEKGIGVDPGWKEISWEEALDEIAARLRKIHAEDPRKLFVQRTTTNTSLRAPFAAFCAAFGTPNSWAAGGGLHCGNGAHLIGGIMHASWSLVPDFEHCRYAIYFGASKGHGAGHASTPNMELAADARARGMRRPHSSQQYQRCSRRQRRRARVSGPGGSSDSSAARSASASFSARSACDGSSRSSSATISRYRLASSARATRPASSSAWPSGPSGSR